MDYRAALVEANRAFAQTAFAGDPSTPIPTCPGWSMLQLIRHVGRGDRWAAHIINTGSGADLDPRTVPDGRPPDNPDGARAWLESSPRVILGAVAAIGPDTTVATFLGPRPAHWWIRRRLHEATVHGADAALATGQPYQLTSEIAADGIEEWLDRLTAELPSRAEIALANGATLMLSAPDLGLSWTIRGLESGIEWNRGVTTPARTVTLSGPADALFLALVRRRTAEDARLDIVGDAATWTTWLTETPL